MNTLINKTGRIISIDRFRGLIMILMVLANFYSGIEWIPALMKHAEPDGLTIVDLIAPGFLFMIALTFPLSFEKRMKKEGKQKALSHALIRGFAIIGIGLLISSGESLFLSDDGVLSFGVLEIIGFAIVFSVPFINSSVWVKLSAGIALGCIHQFLVLPEFSEALLLNRYDLTRISGPASLMLISLALSDLFFKAKNKIPYILCSIGLTAAGIILSFHIPVHRSLYNLSLVTISTGIISMSFYILHLFSEKFLKNEGVLCKWGHNPLVIFILHYLLLLIFMVPSASWWYTNVPLPLLFVQTLCYLSILHLVILYLEKKGSIIKL